MCLKIVCIVTLASVTLDNCMNLLTQFYFIRLGLPSQYSVHKKTTTSEPYHTFHIHLLADISPQNCHYSSDMFLALCLQNNFVIKLNTYTANLFTQDSHVMGISSIHIFLNALSDTSKGVNKN